jgi:predicted transcriptional regulator
VLPTEDNPPEMENKPALIELATQIVAAYVTKNPVEQADLPKLITEVHRALEKAAAGPPPGGVAAAELKPAVNIKRSITPDYLICLEDGKKFKSLKRHLRTHFGLTPGTVPREMGAAVRLPHGGAQLRHLALQAREEHGPRAQAQEMT